MPDHIYRFELKTAWNSNSCTAWDPGNEREVNLLRYARPADRMVARQRLEEAVETANRIEPEVEVFTDLNYLYIASPTASMTTAVVKSLVNERILPERAREDPVPVDSGTVQASPVVAKNFAPVVPPRPGAGVAWRILGMLLLAALVVSAIRYWASLQTQSSGKTPAGSGPLQILYFRATTSASNPDQVLLSWDIENASTLGIRPRLSEELPSPDNSGSWRSPGVLAPIGHIYTLTAKASVGTCLTASLDLRQWQGNAKTADTPTNCGHP